MTREERLEKKRSYYYRNRERCLARDRERYRKNREKICQYQREYNQTHAVKVAARKKEYRERNVDRLRVYGRLWHRFRKYGLTREAFSAMLEAQGGVCAICKRPPHGGRGGVLCVDHNHSTGKVRALLCHHCNMVIGYAEEDIARLLAMVEYLRAHSS